MEGISTRVYKGIKSYWRRRHYQRLRLNRLDSSVSNRRRRFWQFRITPRLKLKFKLKLKLKYSPKKLLIGIRDGYVKMMMKMASSPVVYGNGGYGYGEGIANFGMKPMKEYDEKMIIEIYKSLAMRQKQLLPIDDVSQTVVSR